MITSSSGAGSETASEVRTALSGGDDGTATSTAAAGTLSTGPDRAADTPGAGDFDSDLQADPTSSSIYKPALGTGPGPALATEPGPPTVYKPALGTGPGLGVGAPDGLMSWQRRE